MTISISANTPRVSYTVGNGVSQSAFAIPFEFFDSTDVTVFVNGSAQTLSTHYTLSGGSGSTGVCNFGTAITGGSSGTVIVISRGITLQRTTDFPSSGAFQIGALNTELDKFIAIAADLKDGTARSLTLNATDPDVSLTLPSVADRKGTTLAFHATNGSVIAGPSITELNAVTSNINTAIASAESATASKNSATASATTATNAATSATNALNSANLPTSFNGQAGKIIQVNSAANAYEFATSATNNGVFYGLKVNQSTGHLVLDYSVLGQSASFNLSDYDNYFFSSPQVTFALDTSGDLIITTP